MDELDDGISKGKWRPGGEVEHNGRTRVDRLRHRIRIMTRKEICAAIASAVLTLFIALELIASFGLPTPAVLHVPWLHRIGGELWHESVPVLGDVSAGSGTYLLGVGKADITGPVVEINMMGYASLPQKGTGLRQRLYARTFIVGEPDTPQNRVVYIVLDTQSGDAAIRDGILRGIEALGPEYRIYTKANIALTGTHQHSGPGGWLNYLLPQVTALGFNKQSYQAIVQGTVLSIQRAHQSLTPGRLTFGKTNVTDASINRSGYAYLANPNQERAHYEHDTDKEMSLLSFRRSSDNKAMGVLSWFAVHGTSALENNTIITADNKGVAAYLFEKTVAGSDDVVPGFVAGFSQANVGDTTPNVLGAWCEDGSGQMCKFEDSTCNNRSQACHGRGPLFTVPDNGLSSCYEIGRRQFVGAKSIFDSLAEDGTAVSGPVRFFHAYQDMSSFQFALPNGTTVTTCPAALGHSFAAGTSDGPGAFDFKQNDPDAPNNPLWNAVRNFLHTPSEEQVQCQYPKPILLDAGETTRPYLWAPNIVDLQTFRIGQLFSIIAPGEATTMSGRRWKSAVTKFAKQNLGIDKPLAVIGGPANVYAHYIATEEEYGIQRYEGASTLYGPHTFNAYLNLTLRYMPSLAESPLMSVPPGPDPPIYTNSSLSFTTGVIYDAAGLGKQFGQVVTNPRPTVARGSTASAVFIGANPRNNLRLEGTFAAIEQFNPSATTWRQVLDDADWELTYEWKRISETLATSQVTLTWAVPAETKPGIYRFHYYGDSKSLFGGKISSFEGMSNQFNVL